MSALLSTARRWVFCIAAVLFGLLATLVTTEVIFRIFEIRPPQSTPTDQVDAFKVRNEVNELGLREPPGFPPPRRPGEFRIACLGDSMTYGEGVETEEAYPHVMSELISERLGPQRLISVVNMGWPGNDTAMERKRFVAQADRISPDVLILGFYVNDFAYQLTGPSDMLHRIYDLRDDHFVFSEFSYLFHYAEKKIRLRLAYNETLRYYRADSVRGVEPAAFEPVAREIIALRDFAEARKVRFVLAMIPWLVRFYDYPLTAMHARLGEFARENEIPYCDLVSAFDGQREEPMRVSLANHHPSVAAHRIIAGRLVEFLDKQDLLPRGESTSLPASRGGD